MSFIDLAALSIHDVKNRLAALAARAEAKGDTDTVRDALNAAAQLTHLLACYKADTGQLGVDIDAHCPADLANELIAENQPLTAIKLTADCQQAPALWFYDEMLVRMVLANALQNSLRYARQQITLRIAEIDDWIEFSVSDDGDGYPEEILTNPNRPTAMGEAGAGIGLYLSHKVAALHENHGLTGSIVLSNSPGAVFSLRLPR